MSAQQQRSEFSSSSFCSSSPLRTLRPHLPPSYDRSLLRLLLLDLVHVFLPHILLLISSTCPSPSPLRLPYLPPPHPPPHPPPRPPPHPSPAVAAFRSITATLRPDLHIPAHP
eukprot:762511-Hanusia_phi.AAC.2